MLGRSSGNHDWLLANASAFAFLAVFVNATHATQAIAFEWKPDLRRSAFTADIANHRSFFPAPRPPSSPLRLDEQMSHQPRHMAR